MNTHDNVPELTPAQIRQKIRQNQLTRPTAGLASGYVQTNVAILPKELSYDFKLFCEQNPKSCPLIEVLEPGSTEAINSAPNSDIRSDVGLYKIYKNGVLSGETSNIRYSLMDSLSLLEIRVKMEIFITGCLIMAEYQNLFLDCLLTGQKLYQDYLKIFHYKYI